MGEDDSDMGIQINQQIMTTENGTQRLELNVTYGDSTITNIFEVRDGELEQLPDPESPLGSSTTDEVTRTDGESTASRFQNEDDSSTAPGASGLPGTPGGDIAAFANGAQEDTPASVGGIQEAKGIQEPEEGEGSAKLRMRSRRSRRRV
ncbi:MAG: hypothetical protein Q9174_006663 [Haloplaca sp. 1 TL-2023]